MPYSTYTQQASKSCNRNTIDEQTAAQTELYSHLTAQAQEIAPEPLTTVQINPNHFEIYAGKWLVAYITYDYSEFVTQPWIVMVNGVEKFRHSTQARCFRFIEWHHKDGTLNPQTQTELPEVPFISEISFYDQEVLADGELVASVSYSHDDEQNSFWQVIINNVEIFTDSTPARCHSYVKQQYQAGLLPVQQPFEEPCTDNRTMAHIFNECQRYGLELLDDGIYQDDVKLGQVGYTNGNWWVIQRSNGLRQYSDSVFDVVRMLVENQSRSCEELLDLPVDELTALDWQKLQQGELERELIAA